ncbi:hypothetical protein Plhal703r1_c22g0095681 [Plasmopara halstedii]
MSRQTQALLFIASGSLDEPQPLVSQLIISMAQNRICRDESQESKGICHPGCTRCKVESSNAIHRDDSFCKARWRVKGVGTVCVPDG